MVAFATVWCAGSLRFFRLCRTLGFVEERIMFTCTPKVSRKHFAVCITAVVVPYEIWGLSVDLAVSTMSLICEGSSTSYAGETALSRGFCVFSASAPILEKTKDQRRCVLAGLGRCFTDGTFLMFRITGGASVAGCTISRGVSLLCRLIWDSLAIVFLFG